MRTLELLPLCGIALINANAGNLFVPSSILLSTRSCLSSRALCFPAFGRRQSRTFATAVHGTQAGARRSVLFVPPRMDRAVSVAQTCEADTVVFDLEDAVAPVHKAEARTKLAQAMQQHSFRGKEVAVRCNGLSTEWLEEDLAMIAHSGAHACVIPKVESRLQIEEARRRLLQHGAPALMELWAMIETPLGVLQAHDIASAAGTGSPHPLSALVVGSSDLTKELHAQHTSCRHPLLPSLQLVLLAARRRQLSAIDGVHFALDDADEFAAHCRQGREMGFDGKSLLHPKQIAVCNAIFARPKPTAAPAPDPDTYCTEWAYQVDTWE